RGLANGRAREPQPARAAANGRQHVRAAPGPAPGQDTRDIGDVVIRERPPRLAGRSQTMPQAMPGRKAARGDELSRLDNVVRTHDDSPRRRPMPSVEDFPIVGQREYWAKA